MKGRAVLSPEDIGGRELLVSLRGYDREQVDGFRAQVAAQLRQCPLRTGALEAGGALPAEQPGQSRPARQAVFFRARIAASPSWLQLHRRRPHPGVV